MAIEKILQTRIMNKVDTLENWNKSTLKIKQGEICFATVAASAGTGLTEPVVMAKIGGSEEKTFSELPWSFYAKAADVVSACKSEASLRTFINGVIADAGIASSDAMEALAGRVTNTENDIKTLKGDENTAGSVAKAIKDAIDALDLANTYATKSEAQGYANAKDSAIQEAKQAGLDAASALNTYKGEMVTALAGKQDVIPANTYDAYGSASGALDEAKGYVDQKFTDANLAQYTTEDEVKSIVDGVIAGAADSETYNSLTKLVDYIDTHGGEASDMAQAIDTLEGKVETIEGKPAYGITATQVSNWDNEVGAKALAGTKTTTAEVKAQIEAYDYVKKSEAVGYGDILTKTDAQGLYQAKGEYASAEQGAKADSALQAITTTANNGLKVTNNNNIDIDDTITWIFDCGNSGVTA